MFVAILSLFLAGHLQGAVPAAPAGVNASDGTYTDKVRVTWSAVLRANGYAVWRSTTTNLHGATRIGSAAGTVFNDIQVVPGRVYWYSVRATNAAGASAFSIPNSGYMAVLRALSSLSAIDGSRSPSPIIIKWAAVTGATAYEIWRSPNANTASAVKIGDTTANSCEDHDSSLVPDSTYYYWVKARNTVQTSGFSSSTKAYRSPYAWAALYNRYDRDYQDLLYHEAYYSNPCGVAMDRAGALYVAEMDYHTIRRITESYVETIAGLKDVPGGMDGKGDAARFRKPHGVAVDGSGNVYVADTGNDKVRKVTPDGVVTTFAAGITFSELTGVAVDGIGNVYLTDNFQSGIQYGPGVWKVTPAGVSEWLTLSSATPTGVAVDNAGNVFVAISSQKVGEYRQGNMILNLGPTGQDYKTIASESEINSIERTSVTGIAVDGAGNIYVADPNKHRILKGTPLVPTRYTLTVECDGPLCNAYDPLGVLPFGGSVGADPSPVGDGKYAGGTVVTLTANSASIGLTYRHFQSWSGDLTGNVNPTSILMDSDKKVTAHFEGGMVQMLFALTLEANPVGSGSITADPPPDASGLYASGQTVTLTAVPAWGYRFVAWEGDVSGTVNPTSLKIKGNVAMMVNLAIARFAPTSLTPVPDFNDDGKVDLLLQHHDGRIATWLMYGSDWLSGQYLNPRQPGPGGR